MFKPVNKNRIFEDIIDQIQEMILSGTLKAGDRLPSERSLTETFGVGRGTLREAIRCLEQKGLIEIRMGSNGGAFVKIQSGDQIRADIGMLIRLQHVSLGHLAEFREGIESALTAIAVTRATGEDIALLQEIQCRAAGLITQGISAWDEFLATDNEFHNLVARIAANPLFTVTHQSVHDHILPYYQKYLPPDHAFMHRINDDLAAIVHAFTTRDATAAHARAFEHVCWFNGVMESNRNKSTDRGVNSQ